MRRHQLIICVDIEGSSGSSRTDLHRKSARAGMYGALRSALGTCGVALDESYCEDRGDGAFVLLPADVPKDRVLRTMPLGLATALAGHNHGHAPQERVRLRVAFNAGEVDHDRYGVVGDALDKTFRLLDSPALKDALAASPGLVAVIASERIYHEVIWHFPAARPEIYQRVRVTVKETDTTAWVCLPDAPDSLDATDHSPRPGPSGPPAPSEGAATAKALLAEVVREQWSKEATLRSVDSPDPMPVRWKLTDRDEILDNPDNIASPEADLAGLTGSSDRIRTLTGRFRGLRRRRLVIVGDPGTGKTTLAMQLLLDLLETRPADEPVPVMFSVAGWDTETFPGLHEWLVDRVRQEHPFLRARHLDTDLAKWLVDGGQVLPVLDGLDDLPGEARLAVVKALNTSLRKDDQLILTSRTGEYSRTIERLGSALESAAVIEPEPLTAGAAAGYLRRCLPKTLSPGWQELVEHLETRRHRGTSPLAETVETPLGLWLLRIAYVRTGADPAELLDPGLFPTAAALRASLFDRYIPASIELRPPSDDPAERLFRPRGRHDPEMVRNWLGHLARLLDEAGTRDFAWWRLNPRSLEPRTLGFTPRVVRKLLHGLAYWFAVGFVIGFVIGLPHGPAGGVLDGLVYGALGLWFGLVRSRFETFSGLAGTPEQARQMSMPVTVWRTDRSLALSRSVLCGLPIGIMSGVASGYAWGFQGGIVTGLAAGLGALTVGVLLPPLPLSPRPHALSIASALMYGLMSGLVLGVTSGPVPGMAAGISGGLIGGISISILTVNPSRLVFQKTAQGALKAVTILKARTNRWIVSACAVPTGTSVGIMTGLPTTHLVGAATGIRSGIVAGIMAAFAIWIFARSQAKCVSRIPSRLGTVDAWQGYVTATYRAARDGLLPRRLMPFLDDMHRLGLLRTVGPFYQFRHAELQDHLAAAYRQGARAPAPDILTPRFRHGGSAVGSQQ